MLRQLETGFGTIRSKPKRKLSPWNKFVKANSKKLDLFTSLELTKES